MVAAFEIESTTSIYSGLLRMSDLIAMQPNLNIPLYLVAPNERRQKVFAEVNRSTGQPSPGCLRRWWTSAASLPSRLCGTSSARSARSSAT